MIRLIVSCTSCDNQYTRVIRTDEDMYLTLEELEQRWVLHKDGYFTCPTCRTRFPQYRTRRKARLQLVCQECGYAQHDLPLIGPHQLAFSGSSYRRHWPNHRMFHNQSEFDWSIYIQRPAMRDWLRQGLQQVRQEAAEEQGCTFTNGRDLCVACSAG